jgi:hypothetical protein
MEVSCDASGYQAAFFEQLKTRSCEEIDLETRLCETATVIQANRSRTNDCDTFEIPRHVGKR